MTRLQRRFALLFVPVLVLGVFVFFRLSAFNYFTSIEPRFAGECSSVTGVAGPEDIQIDHGSRRAFISSFDRRAKRRGDAMRGAIFSVNVDDPLDMRAWRDQTGGIPEKFEPSGIYFYQGEGVSRLFVVNSATNAVELFDVSPQGTLMHLETLSERRLTNPKDLVATGPRSFYITNDTSSRHGTLFRWLQYVWELKTGNVLFYNGMAWRSAADSLRIANGINMSPDGKRVYIAETSARSMKVYDRDVDSNLLTLSRTVKIGAAPHNIDVDEKGAVWIGSMPKPLQLWAHIRSAKNIVPSKVFRFADRPSNDSAALDEVRSSDPLQEIYSGPGSSISGSTTAARLGDKILIGAMMEDRYLLCDMAS